VLFCQYFPQTHKLTGIQRLKDLRLKAFNDCGHATASLMIRHAAAKTTVRAGGYELVSGNRVSYRVYPARGQGWQ
jgi:hypothetical protein